MIIEGKQGKPKNSKPGKSAFKTTLKETFALEVNKQQRHTRKRSLPVNIMTARNKEDVGNFVR